MIKKSKNFIRYFSLSLVLMLCMTLIPNLDAYAYDVSAYVSGDDLPSTTTTYAEGISPTKSGYMVYVVDQNGNAVSPDAKFVSSSSYTFNRGADAIWSVNSRLGGYWI